MGHVGVGWVMYEWRRSCKGDIVKQPMKKGSFVPKNVPGVGWGGSCRGGVGWGGSCRGGVGWVLYSCRVGWVM